MHIYEDWNLVNVLLRTIHWDSMYSRVYENYKDVSVYGCLYGYFQALLFFSEVGIHRKSTCTIDNRIENKT